MKSLAFRGIGERRRPRRASLVRLQQQEQLPEYLAQVAPIDFIDDEHIRDTRILQSLLAEPKKRAIHAGELAVWTRPITLDEILV